MISTDAARVGVAVAVVLVLLTTLASAASTQVELEPEMATAPIGETEAYEVVVDDAEHGVESYNVSVRLGSRRIARIVDVELLVGTGEARIDDGNRTAFARAEGGETRDGVAVAIVRVTVRGRRSGSTAIDLTVHAVVDERGDAYRVTDTHNADLRVPGFPGVDTPTPSPTPVPPSSPSPSPTPTPTATHTPTPTTSPTSSPTATSSPVPSPAATGTRVPTDTPDATTPTEGGGPGFGAGTGLLGLAIALRLLGRRP